MPDPSPIPWEKKYFGELATPSEYPLAWHWYQMRVGQLVYPYIKEGRQKVSVYISFTLGAAFGYPEANAAREVLKDEKLIPFHVAIDIGYGEHSSLADIIDLKVSQRRTALIFYCGTGWRSSIAFLVAFLLGLRAKNYDSGFYGWSWNAENEITLGSPEMQ